MADRDERRRKALALLEELYRSLPEIACKGLCHDTCTSTDASELERERIRERGVELPGFIPVQVLRARIKAGDTPRCPALGPLNTCTVYDVRPLLCRAWGTTPRLQCDYGCVPSGYVPDVDLMRALVEVEELSEWATGVSRKPPPPR